MRSRIKDLANVVMTSNKVIVPVNRVNTATTANAATTVFVVMAVMSM